MFIEDTIPFVSSKEQPIINQSLPTFSFFVIFLFGKLLRIWAVVKLFYIFEVFSSPIVGLFLFLGAFLGLIITGKIKSFEKVEHKLNITKLVFHTLWMIGSFYFWVLGLRYLAPTRTILIEYAEYCLVIFVGMILGWKRSKNISVMEMITFYGSLFLILLSADNITQFDSWTDIFSFENSEFGPNTIGLFYLLIASTISILRKNHAKRLSVEYGNFNLYFYTISISGIIMLIFTFLNLIVDFSYTIEQLSQIGKLIQISFYGILIFVIPYLCDTFTKSLEHTVPKMASIGLLWSTLLSLVFYESNLFLSIPHWTIIIALPMMMKSVSTFVESYGPSTSISGSTSLLKNPNSTTLSKPRLPNLEGLTNYMKFILSNSDSKYLFLFLLVNLSFMFVELIYGIIANSLGLISDSAHMLFDCSALAIGLYGAFMSKWKPNQNYTYGYGRYETLSGFVNGLLLLFIAIYIIIEAIHRTFDPPIVQGPRLLTISIIGLLINLTGVIFFHGDHSHNDNIYGIYLHMLADTLGSVGVITSTLLMKYFEWYWADPICSLCISILILVASYPLLYNSIIVLLQRSPPEMDLEIEQSIEKMSKMEGVEEIYDIHFWRMNSMDIVGSMHIKVNDDADHQSILTKVTDEFRDLGVNDLTVQIEKKSFLLASNKSL